MNLKRKTRYRKGASSQGIRVASRSSKCGRMDFPSSQSRKDSKPADRLRELKTKLFQISEHSLLSHYIYTNLMLAVGTQHNDQHAA